MSVENDLNTAANLLHVWTQEATTPEPERLDVRIDVADLLAAVKTLHDAHWGYLSAITGLDLGAEAGEPEVLYHFCEGAAVVTLRVRTPRTDPSVPSLYPIIPMVTVYERELIEMFGVEVTDTPDPSRLFLPDDWPEGVKLLRKDFDIADAAREA